MVQLAFLHMPGGWEWLIILAIGLLLFGRRLPEVGRSLGKSIVEFKKGIKGIEDEIEGASAPPSSPSQPKPQLTDKPIQTPESLIRAEERSVGREPGAAQI